MKVKTKYGVLENNLIVKKLLKTEPMNIDEQIRKSISIEEIEINQYVTDEIISQIKQSILKAIMKKVNKEFFCVHCNNSGKVWDGFLGNWVPCETENDCLFTVVCKFESVIKEVLK